MMLRRLVLLGLAISVCLASICLSSCNRCVIIRVFNNTGSQIAILGLDPGGQRETWTVDARASADLGYFYRWEIRKADHPPVIWYYQPCTIKYIADQYLTNNWLRCRRAAAQIEPDGKIWILPPGTRAIVAQPTTQPAGFPAKPDKVEKG